MGFLRTLLALRIGEQRCSREGGGHGGNWHIFGSQDLELPRELCPLPSPFSGQGSRSFPLAHLLTHLRLQLLRNMTPAVKIN